MADRYFVDGGGTLNWGTTANWSTTSGGAGGASIAGGSDVAIFDANSPNMTNMDSNRTVQAINFTGYTNTFTLGNTLTVNGTTADITLGSSMTFSGTSLISWGSATGGTLTSNGITIPSLTITNNGTYALADNAVVNTTLSLSTGTQTPVVNSFQITCHGSLSMPNTSGNVTGTTAIILDGTGTWSGTSTSGRGIGLNLTINTSGTITISGTVRFSATFTHTAGTVITTGSTIICSTIASTWNAPNVIFNNMSFTNSVTHTISATLNILGTLSLGGTSSATVLDGSPINVSGGLSYAGTTGIISGTSVINLIDDQVFNSTGAITTGRLEGIIYFNAPGKTIYFDDTACPIFWSNVYVAPGTRLMSSNGTFPTVGLIPQNLAWLE